MNEDIYLEAAEKLGVVAAVVSDVRNFDDVLGGRLRWLRLGLKGKE